MTQTETKPESKPEAKPPVYTPEHPEYPKAVYNQKTRQTKAAKDKDDEAKLAKDGFTEEALPPLDPNALTPEEVQTFQGLLAKVSKYVATLPTTPAAGSKPADKPNGPPKQNDQHHHV